MLNSSSRAGRHRGITLTEILIAIFIMGVGLVSLATLFPIGLLRLRDATRYSRSAYLAESAASDLVSRGLLTSQSFLYADIFNANSNNPPNAIFPVWYSTTTSGRFDPFIQDTPFYGGDWFNNNQKVYPGAYAGNGGAIVGRANAAANTVVSLASNAGVILPPINGPGLPFVYDPLWRAQTNFVTTQNGVYLDQYNAYNLTPQMPEARFGCGDGWGFRADPFPGNPAGSTVASAHGLQRLTNFSPAMPVVASSSTYVASIFVSPEDVVWQEATNPNYTLAYSTTPVGPAPSTVLPDMNISGNSSGVYQPTNDFNYSWIFTGQLTNAGNEACFDGNVVIFEKRQFGVIATSGTNYQIAGETVVEAVFGYSTNTNIGTSDPTFPSYGYGIGADRTVMLRWPSTIVDPTVKPGDWIADVTYERSQPVVQSRWWQGNAPVNGQGNAVPAPIGVANINNNLEWDNLPPQRCIWYQVQKVSPVETAVQSKTNSTAFSTDNGVIYRYMIVNVASPLQARTLLMNGNGYVEPAILNAALICPSVVNVIPKTIFVR